ncbi:HDOD domain-containing protein [Janthinobacterium aquaticum]|uniref:HDOD domain-containing protein n=1 Tax=Janthinobacterium sp. FT58W TaxID=2654254 RepID=UPI0012645A0B|nr:HDOD domain-containing protein [Janthinobacterium sp. FT58W]KAB8036577.1 HDOD domain-containing protein [Janthinobacterium sp. FT58W]
MINKLQAFGLIVAQAARGELTFPTSVNSALQLQLALAEPDCHIDQAIKLVLAEPVLAARTVALANSAVHSRGAGAPVTSVRAAVMRMGYRNLYALVAAMVVRQFGSKIVDPLLRQKAEQLWEHTAHVAALAHVLARRVTRIDADTALFAGIVHAVGGFYLLSRADEFPGLLDDDEERWMESAEEIISREVIRKLAIPAPVSEAIEGLRDGLLAIPPDSLLDTLLLAKQLSPVPSPLQVTFVQMLTPSDSVIDFIIDNDTLQSILAESSEEVASMSAALLV